MTLIIEPTSGPHAVITSPIPGLGLINWTQYSTVGLTNGYSKYPCINVTGEFFLAFHLNSTDCGLWSIEPSGAFFVKNLTNPYNTSSANGIGVVHDVRWDISGRPGTEYRILFTQWEVLFSINDVRKPLDKTNVKVLCKIPGDPKPTIAHEGHMDQAWDEMTKTFIRAIGAGGKMWLWAEWPGGSKLYPTTIPQNAFDLSPDGNWLFTSSAADGSNGQFWSIHDLDVVGESLKSIPLPSPVHGHDGWCWYQDRWWYVYHAPKVDKILAFCPEIGGPPLKLIDTPNFAVGANCNFHLTTMPKSWPGWILVSFYGGNTSDWSYQQLILLSFDGRIVRLGPSPLLFGGDKNVEGAACMSGLVVATTHNNDGKDIPRVFMMDLAALHDELYAPPSDTVWTTTAIGGQQVGLRNDNVVVWR